MSTETKTARCPGCDALMKPKKVGKLQGWKCDSTDCPVGEVVSHVELFKPEPSKPARKPMIDVPR